MTARCIRKVQAVDTRVAQDGSSGAPRPREAQRATEGAEKAQAYLARLHAQQADPDELALILAALYGATLRGFCRVIEKALGVGHG